MPAFLHNGVLTVMAACPYKGACAVAVSSSLSDSVWSFKRVVWCMSRTGHGELSPVHGPVQSRDQLLRNWKCWWPVRGCDVVA